MSIMDTVLAAKADALNNPTKVAERLEKWRSEAKRLWDGQAMQFLGANDADALKALIAVSFGFVDQAHLGFQWAINMVLGHVVWTKAYLNKTEGAEMKVTADLVTGNDGTTRETLTFTFGDEYLGAVTRITGKAGQGYPMLMGMEVTVATSSSRATVQA